MAKALRWGGPALVAAVLLATGCDSVDVGDNEEPGSYHSAAMGIRFHRKESHVIREKTESDVSSLSINPGSESESWGMGGAAMLSTVTPTTDAEDIESLIASASEEFKSAPARGKRLVPEVGTYVKLSGIIMASGEQGQSMELVQENYYMGANGRVYTFAFVAEADDAAQGRAEFEAFLTSIRFE